ncbi:enterochelin esterase [Rhodococcus hoagii]|uniref:Esterase n=1 Tax=Prescottella equi ATCC 33707 TaxID=525370 RepID=E9T4P8_RHOHA|nr:enterochelin esterase [Prescottella equi]EGD22781.1 putative esterase [Prescottella equi ATCC 33707]MBM4591595.1 enterochelin esterase [Prescottella equi]MBM4640956.1 enterochelin esterase [Prescottella equi]MBM4668429.1 enterochelin esterase [Prescottella equi]NKV88843.1 enterochelin esterase [Prescottella equi]
MSDVEAVDDLQRRLQVEGGPLIDPGPPGFATVTFVWRAPAGSPVRHVYLEANGVTDRRDPDANALRRLPGSDLWVLSRQVPEAWRGGYGFLPRVDPITEPAAGQTEWEWWRGVIAGLVTDELNPLPVVASMGLPARSEAVMPGAPPQRWWVHGAAPRGRMTEERRSLAGVDRSIWFYEPPGLVDRERPVLIVFDGRVAAVEIPLAPALDRLGERGHRVPLVVMIDSIDPGLRSRELPCSPEFLDALTGDLLPHLRARWGATGDPASVLVGGSSYGGLAATFAALQAPDYVGGAVSLSGSFWWPRPPMAGRSIQDRLAELEVGGSRFWMAAGLLEPRLIEENREVRDLLRAKGFDVTYREFCGGHDYIQWRDLLVEGASALLGRSDV